MGRCSKNEQDSAQKFPGKGPLSKNWPLNDLCAEIVDKDSKQVYCYVIDTVNLRDGKYIQQGSAPNWQGGLITLCTCKHRMRSYKTIDEWKGVWIAGFTGIKYNNALVYLMKVKKAYRSFKDLWDDQGLWDNTKFCRDAKNSCINGKTLGDLYQPKKKLYDEKSCYDIFNHGNYFEPCNEHSHLKKEAWKEDIKCIYKDKNREKHSPLLVGNPEQSYLWREPTILLSKKPLARNCNLMRLSELFDNLEVRKK